MSAPEPLRVEGMKYPLSTLTVGGPHKRCSLVIVGPAKRSKGEDHGKVGGKKTPKLANYPRDDKRRFRAQLVGVCAIALVLTWSKQKFFLAPGG